MSEKMELTRARNAVVSTTSDAITKEANRQIEVIHEFADKVFAGEDPVRAAKSWSWIEPAKAHFAVINNAYREASGLPLIPYHPGMQIAYRMCEMLLEQPGEWVSAQQLSIRARVGSTLDDRQLADFDWRLEKMTNPKTMYRLVRIEG